jgi:hypothetical protein
LNVSTCLQIFAHLTVSAGLENFVLKTDRIEVLARSGDFDPVDSRRSEYLDAPGWKISVPSSC